MLNKDNNSGEERKVKIYQPEAEYTDTPAMNNQSSEENTEVKTGVYDDFNYLLGENGFDILEEPEPVYRSDKPKKSRKNKTRKKMARGFKTAIWIVSILIISVCLAGLLILTAVEILGIGPNKGDTVTIVVEKGMSTSDIANELKDQGVINSAIGFRIYSKLGGHDGKYMAGSRTFKDELGYGDIIDMLQKPGKTNPTVTVTIPEQASMDDIIKLLVDNGVCTKEDFRNAVKNGTYDFDFIDEIPVDKVYYKFEGYLFPDTYVFYCADTSESSDTYTSAECAELAIRKMLSNTNAKLEPLMEDIEKSNYSLHEIMTMASIVELEASAAPDEMSNVAAVFYNRLEGKNWEGPKKLQSDPTTKYPYGEGRYNTYESEGLPPGPLCSPSLNAIKGAVYPTENFTATYFVTDDVMDFYYNNSLAAHNQIIASLKNQGKWVG